MRFHATIRVSFCAAVTAVFFISGSLLLYGAPKLTSADLGRLRQTGKILEEQIREMETDLTSSPSLNKYRKEFMLGIPDLPGQPISWQQLSAHLAKARYVLMGDEHTVPDSQTNTMRVMRAMVRGKGSVTLVLEWIDESFQSKINNFLAGKGSLTKLRKAISFDSLWGFSWKSYSRILTYAKREKIRILLTERLKVPHSLQIRDQYITNKLSDDRKMNPAMRYLVVYGEYHVLGSDHLSDKLYRLGFNPHTAIFGEGEKLYWDHLQKERDVNRIKILQFGKRLYYVCNGSPLLKSWSYRNYLMSILGYTEDDFDDYVSLDDLLPLGPE